MSTKIRSESKPPAAVPTSSSMSGNEDASTPKQPNERKTKRFVKKKGETRKRNSIDHPGSSSVRESLEFDKILKKLEKVKIETEKEETPSSTTNNNSIDDKEKPDTKSGEESTATARRIKNIENLGKGNGKKLTSETDEACDRSEAGKNPVSKSPNFYNPENNEQPNIQDSVKNFDKGKTAEERKRDRQTARFAKAVARFSMKFTKAARDLGIIQPELSSASCSDSSSTSTESSCSSSCTCSDCCTTDTSTCSCSDCNPEGSSTSSSTSGSPTSCSTLNSSTSGTSDSMSSSSPGTSTSEISMKLHEKKESGIHRVQEVALEELDLTNEYNVEKTLGEGSFAKVLLATHKRTKTRVVLKAVHQELTSEKDFYREFHYSYHLSPHPNILSSYAVAFKAENCYVFAQEYAPFGDLSGNVKAGGLSEDVCKKICGQLASALDFLHSKQLAHRDVKLENILVFTQDMSKIKLCDFGCTKKEGTLVNKIRCTWVPFLPPEVYEVIKNERYTCKRSTDCWQFGIVLFVCLTGNPPWQSADLIQDPDYSGFQRWLKRRTTKIPAMFRRFTPRLLRYFRRIFEHKPEKRATVTEVNKYLKDSWCVSKLSHSATSTSVDVSESLARRGDSLLYLDTLVDDKTNVDENKNKLRKLLNSYGLETTVDQKVVTKRIWEWVMQCDSDIGEPGLIGGLSSEPM